MQQNGDIIGSQVENKTFNQTCPKTDRNNGNPNINKQTIKYHNHAIPGVFNCRFSNPVCASTATKRKKKKPTSFVPPPTIASLAQVAANNLGPMATPFWRRPLPTQHSHQVLYWTMKSYEYFANSTKLNSL